MGWCLVRMLDCGLPPMGQFVICCREQMAEGWPSASAGQLTDLAARPKGLKPGFRSIGRLGGPTPPGSGVARQWERPGGDFRPFWAFFRVPCRGGSNFAHLRR